MNLSEMIKKELIIQSEGADKEVLLRAMTDLIEKTKYYIGSEALFKAIMYRESLMSTGIGLSIAVPHARMEDITEPFMTIAVDKKGVNGYESMDSKPVHIVIMIIAGKGTHREYLRMLSDIVMVMKEKDMVKQLMNAETNVDISNALRGGSA